MKKIFLALMGAIASLSSCSHQYIQTVDADQFESMLSDHKIQLLDVRTAEEYAAGFIPNAINIDVNKSDFKEKVESLFDKHKPIGIYCRSGRRSLVGADILVKSQFKVVNLRGGIMEWSAKGKAIKK